MISVFISYSHEDDDLRNELEIALSALKRQGVIDVWHDRRISAGTQIDTEISEHLDAADVILLLVSSYFIASDYCYGIEMERAMERHKSGQARVIPVILRPCDWQGAPFGQLLALPQDGKPVTKFPDMHDAFLQVSAGLRHVANELQAAKRSTEVQAVSNTTDQPTTEKLATGDTRRARDVRSSNLRIKRKFTDKDKDAFLDEAFEYVANFFENSLAELKDRHPGIDVSFKRVDTRRFFATVYVEGTTTTRCSIWRGSRNSFADGIAYTAEETTTVSSYNKLISVRDDGYSLFLQPLGAGFRSRADEQLTPQGAAEYLWGIFISPLQT